MVEFHDNIVGDNLLCLYADFEINAEGVNIQINYWLIDFDFVIF